MMEMYDCTFLRLDTRKRSRVLITSAAYKRLEPHNTRSTHTYFGNFFLFLFVGGKTCDWLTRCMAEEGL